MLAATACAGSAPVTLTIEGGPILTIAEGTHRKAIIHAPANAVLVLDVPIPADQQVAQFYELTIRSEQDGAVLSVAPRCSVVHPGQGPALVPVRVSDERSGEAASITLHITPQDFDECAPRVTAWLEEGGACASAPLVTGTRLEPRITASSQLLCVRVESLDPGYEELWVRGSTTAPPSLLRTDTLALYGAEAATFQLPLGPTASLRGEFTVAVEVFRHEPVTDERADVSTVLTLVLGEPGDLGISVLSLPVTATEFEQTELRFRLWHYASRTEPLDAIPCARVTHATGQEVQQRGKPYVIYAATGQPHLERSWSCGTDFLAWLSPPIDAPSLDQVTIEGRLCAPSECGTGLLPSSQPVTRAVDVSVTSVADHVDPGFSESRFACVELTGMGAPELIAIPPSTDVVSPARLYVGDATQLRYGAPLDIPAPAPTELLALRWGATNIVLGRIGNTIKVLQRISGTWSWGAADSVLPGLPADTSLQGAVALGPAAVGPSTHLAYLAPDEIHIRALGESAEVVLPFSCGLLAAADLDGDLATDLVCAGDTIWLLRLDWSAGLPALTGQREVTARFHASATTSAARLTSQLGNEVFLSGPVVAEGDVELIQITGGSAVFDPSTASPVAEITPIGHAVGVAAAPGTLGVDSRLLVGTTAGIWEPTLSDASACPPYPSGTNTCPPCLTGARIQGKCLESWQQQDPVLKERTPAGVPLTAERYGRPLVPCLRDPGSTPMIAYLTHQNQIRVTALDLSVEFQTVDEAPP